MVVIPHIYGRKEHLKDGLGGGDQLALLAGWAKPVAGRDFHQWRHVAVGVATGRAAIAQ